MRLRLGQPSGLRHNVQGLTRAQGEVNADLVGKLNPEEQQTIQAAVNQADQISTQQAALAAGQVAEGAAVNGSH